MADVLERALEPRVPRRGIVARHPYDELTDLGQHPAPSGSLGVRPLAGDQLAMPPQQRVGRRDRGNLPQGRTAESVRSRRKSTAIVVREPQPTCTKLTPQESVFFDQVRDRVPLPAIQPTEQHPSAPSGARPGRSRAGPYIMVGRRPTYGTQRGVLGQAEGGKEEVDGITNHLN